MSSELILFLSCRRIQHPFCVALKVRLFCICALHVHVHVHVCTMYMYLYVQCVYTRVGMCRCIYVHVHTCIIVCVHVCLHAKCSIQDTHFDSERLYILCRLSCSSPPFKTTTFYSTSSTLQLEACSSII